jgi:phosphopantothenoylcysteine decarboxylase/phosphopantothenate--cysteine ligase
MREAVLAEFRNSTMLLMAAAVADYRPARAADQKLKKGKGRLSLELERTVDILADLPKRRGAKLVVGFAAETQDVLTNAARKLREKNLDLIVANDVSAVGAGFEADTNAVVVLDGKTVRELPLASKAEIADQILDCALERRNGRG